MARYIDLDKCGQYRTNHGGYPDTFAFPPWAEFEDVAPVVHAYWFFSKEWNGYRCSNCKGKPLFNSVSPIPIFSKYCPHCGARMDGEKE